LPADLTPQVALSVLHILMLCTAFRNEDASNYHFHQHHDPEQEGTRAHISDILRYWATWLSAAYFLTDVGVETVISGWVIAFMTRSRAATPFLASLSSSGFWVGMAIGRLVMGPATDRLGVRKATSLYCAVVIILEITFSLLPNPIGSVGIMMAMGVFMGPLFPSGVIVLTQLLPRPLHVAAVSFVASTGQIGGALLPFGVGAIVQSSGIEIFQYAILLQSTLALLAWMAFAKLQSGESASSPDVHGTSGDNQ
jgi:fucose permease